MAKRGGASIADSVEQLTASTHAAAVQTPSEQKDGIGREATAPPGPWDGTNEDRSIPGRQFNQDYVPSTDATTIAFRYTRP